MKKETKTSEKTIKNVEEKATGATTANIQNVSKLEGDSALKTVDVKNKSTESTEGESEDANKAADENQSEDESQDEAPKAKKHKANIIFKGGSAKPQTLLTVGRGQYLHLGADPKEQRAGFYHEDAEQIIEQFPDLYEAV